VRSKLCIALFAGMSLLTLGCSDDESGASGSSGSGGAGSGGSSGSGGQNGCSTSSAAALRGCVDKASVVEGLTFVAQPRNPGSAHWQAVQDRCKSRFEESGFTVELHDYGTGVNVVGRKTGVEAPSEQVIVSAHYDHLPGCPGADDNASGVAAVLELARVVKNASFSRTLVLACWDEEETGLEGAEAYANRARSQGDQIVVMYSIEMIGFRSTSPDSQRIPAGLDLIFPEEYAKLQQGGFVGDFLTIIPDTSAAETGHRVEEHAAAIGLPTVYLEITAALKSNPAASDVQRSDHAAFWNTDFPALMLTDTSEFRNDNYHCRNGRVDSVDTLDLDFLTLNVQASVGSAADMLGVR